MNLKKWGQTIKTSWAYYLTYRTNLCLQIIGPTLVFFFIKYNLWFSIYKGNYSKIIQGYSLNDMLVYHLWVMIITLLGQGHNTMNLSEDIRLGRISTYLIYPFNFWEYHTANFLAFQILQILIVSFLLFIVFFTQLIPISFTYHVMIGLLYTLLVSFFWFSTQYFLGLLTFWLDETWILRVIFVVIAQFCSGAFFPIEFFPDWFSNIVYWTPFPFLVSIPIKISMGQHVDLISSVSNLGLWCMTIWFINIYTWKRGLKMYTAAGI